MFLWLVDALASRSRDTGTSDRLREISDNNIGFLRLESFSAAQQAELVSLIRDIPDVARQELPESPGREAIIESVAGLARLASAQQ